MDMIYVTYMYKYIHCNIIYIYRYYGYMVPIYATNIEIYSINI